jgi:hypothetical protein
MGRVGYIATLKHQKNFFSVFRGHVIKDNVSFTKGGGVLISWISTLVGISFFFSLFPMGYQVTGDYFGPVPKKLNRTSFRGVDSETWWELTSSPPSPHLSGIEANWKWTWDSVPSWFEIWNHTEILKKNWFQFQICCGLVRFKPCTSKSESS